MDWKEDLPWSALSKTFQDAVWVTKAIGLRYLWIDSLCIVQDDPLDWERESTNMAQVYGDAHLVIAATRAADGSVGCFSQRPIYKVGSLLADFELHDIYVREQTDHKPINDRYSRAIMPYEADDYPMMMRSWAFQERLLARLLVHYTSHELMWECREARWCECGALEWFVWPDLYSPSLQDLKQQLGSWSPGHSQNMDISALVLFWNRLLAQYTTGKLTVISDRLPAIAGVARQIQRPALGQYLAGLWHTNLMQSLFWYARRFTNPRRPSIYRAPSWSWASIEGGITFHEFSKEQVIHKLAKIVHCSCTAAGTSPFGAITDGRLVIEGAMTRVTLGRTNGHYVLGEKEYAPHQIFFDVESEAEEIIQRDETIFLLPVLMMPGRASPATAVSLLLTHCTEEVGALRRLGMAWARLTSREWPWTWVSRLPVDLSASSIVWTCQRLVLI